MAGVSYLALKNLASEARNAGCRIAAVYKRDYDKAGLPGGSRARAVVLRAGAGLFFQAGVGKGRRALAVNAGKLAAQRLSKRNKLSSCGSGGFGVRSPLCFLLRTSYSGFRILNFVF